MGGPGSGGHNRLPVETHVARGSYRRDRHGPRLAVLSPAQPDVPGCLDELECGVWRALMDVAWPAHGHPPDDLQDPHQVGQFVVTWAAAQRTDDDDRSEGLFTVAMGAAPCALDPARTARFIDLAGAAWDKLHGPDADVAAT